MPDIPVGQIEQGATEVGSSGTRLVAKNHGLAVVLQ